MLTAFYLYRLYLLKFSIVEHPDKVLSGLSTLPNVAQGKVLAGDPAIVTALTRLPKGNAQILTS
jgi:hypothetical protein